MSDRIIEPEEIIVETIGGAPKQDISHVNPWIRCIARFFDYSLFFLLILGVKHFVSFSPSERLIPWEFILWIPIEALLLFLFGATPGKWFLKTKLRLQKRPKFDFKTALRRSFSVWMRGLGMGIIGINVLCLLTAYQKLKIFRSTSWDRDEQIAVTHYPIAPWRIYVATFIAAAGMLYYYSLKTSFFS